MIPGDPWGLRLYFICALGALGCLIFGDMAWHTSYHNRLYLVFGLLP